MAGSGSGEPVRLEGDVRLVNDLAALTAARFDDPAALRTDGPNGDVVGQWDGIGPFALDGVKSAGVVWVQATPGPGDVLRGLRPVTTSAPDAFGVVTMALFVARASDFIEAFDLLSSPIAFSGTAAQAILVAVRDGEPVAGARVVAPRETILYAENGAFSDTATSTDESGIFMVANVPAGEWPGTSITLTLTGSVTGSYALLLVSGGVTVAEVGN